MRMRKKPNLAPRMQRCARLLAAQPELLRGRWLEDAKHKSLHVELGCGKGLFTAQTAQDDKTVFLAALEKSADAMVIALERAAAAELTNVLFINALADKVTDFFAPGEVSRIYINFCDPWPARRHEKRRLTSRVFLELYKKILAPGGEIHFKTDNLPLFEFSLGEFRQCGFELRDVTRNLHENGPAGVMTDYEKRFHGQGVPICRCVAANQAGEGGINRQNGGRQ